MLININTVMKIINVFCLFNFFLTKNKTSIISSIQYFGIIIFFVIGAILGTTLTNIFSLKTVLFSCIGLLIVLLMMFKKR